MADSYDTGMGLLEQAAELLEAVASACDDPKDASRLSTLTERIRSYLSTSRPTTPLGMPHLGTGGNQLSSERVVHRDDRSDHSHVRIV